MLYLISWKIPSANRNEAMQRFAASATDPQYELPEGVTQIGRYHNAASLNGVSILEADDPAKVMQWAQLWNDILELTFEPVVDDEAAGAIVAQEMARLQQ